MDEENIYNEDFNDHLDNQERVPRSYLMQVLIIIMLILVFVVGFWDSMFITIPAGHQGVMFKTFGGGTVIDQHWEEGLVFVYPWDELYIYDTRVISGQDTIDALTEDGIQVEAEISYRYRPEIDSLGLMHKNLGEDYAVKIIIPHVTAATREVVSRYDIEALYTTSRKDVQIAMLARVREEVDDAYPITMLDLVVRNIVLDTTVERAIADKLVKEQEMLAYDYLIQKELKEEERKVIEARGLRRFRDTSRIDVLKFYGIKATEQLATSPNAKVVVIGTDSEDLPVILSGN